MMTTAVAVASWHGMGLLIAALKRSGDERLGELGVARVSRLAAR